MSQKPTDEAIDLALPCHEAIKAIVGERACKECGGTGVLPKVDPRKPMNVQITCRACEPCHGTGKVGWKWKPKWNELAYLDGKIVSIRQHWTTSQKVEMCRVAGSDEKSITIVKGKLIPILPWEKILRILRDLGYSMFVEAQSHNCRATISRDDMEIVRKVGGDCQSAVMQSVIALRKKLKK